MSYDPNQYPAKNSLSYLANHFFLRKGRGDKALILTYLDSPMAEVFSERRFIFVLFYFDIIKFIFLFFAIIMEKRGFKSRQKGQTLGLSFFHEKLNSQKIFEIVILFATSGKKFLKNGTIC